MNKKNILGIVLLVLIIVAIGFYSSQKGLLSKINGNSLLAALSPSPTRPPISNGSSTGSTSSNSCVLTPVGEKLFVMSGNSKNDVWSTINGVNWVNLTQSTPFAELSGPHVLYVDRTFYLFGGVDNNGKGKSIYTSKNAKDWILYGSFPLITNNNYQFDNFSVAYFKNKFWMVSSTTDLSPGVNFWSSADGRTWTQSSSTTFPKMKIHGNGDYGIYFYVFNSKLWLLGVEDSTPNEMKIWSTSDGSNWSYESSPQELTHNTADIRNTANPFVADGKVWIIGGSFDRVHLKGTKDVFSSSDGKTWTLVTTAGPERFGSVTIGFLNKLWTIGGWNSDYIANVYPAKDQWYSSNGSSWTKETFNSNPPTTLLNRWNATGVVAPINASSSAPDLNIVGDNSPINLTAHRQSNVQVAKWTLSGADVVDNFTGTIRLTGLSFTGNKMSDGTSSLQYLRNIRLRVNGVNYGFLSQFTGPFYDTAHPDGIPKDLVFTPTGNTITFTQGQSKTVTLVADVWDIPDITAISIAGQTYNTSLNGTPCSVYGTHNWFVDNTIFSGYPGGTIYPL